MIITLVILLFVVVACNLHIDRLMSLDNNAMFDLSTIHYKLQMLLSNDN